MSCAFCPTAFCSEHCHNKIRLSEYYQLVCLKHADIVLCEDRSVLKIFGLCKSPKTPSSHKPLRRRSSSSGKRTRGEDAGLDGEDRTVSESRSPKHKRKSSTAVSEAREHHVKRSCPDRHVKHKEWDPDILSAQLGKAADDIVRPSPKKEQQADKRHGRHPSEVERKRSHGLQKDNKPELSGHSSSSHGMKQGKRTNDHSSSSGSVKKAKRTNGHSPSSQDVKKSKGSAETSAYYRHQHGTQKPSSVLEGLRKDKRTSEAGTRKPALEVEGPRKDKKTSEAFTHDHSQHKKREQDVDRQAQRRRGAKDRTSTDKSLTESLKFSSSAAASSSSSSLLADVSGIGGVGMRSSGKSAANSGMTPVRSLGDEPLFDNSDDEFPELIIDVP